MVPQVVAGLARRSGRLLQKHCKSAPSRAWLVSGPLRLHSARHGQQETGILGTPSTGVGSRAETRVLLHINLINQFPIWMLEPLHFASEFLLTLDKKILI